MGSFWNLSSADFDVIGISFRNIGLSCCIEVRKTSKAPYIVNL